MLHQTDYHEDHEKQKSNLLGLILLYLLDQSSIERRKTITKVIALANHKEGNQ